MSLNDDRLSDAISVALQSTYERGAGIDEIHQAVFHAVRREMTAVESNVEGLLADAADALSTAPEMSRSAKPKSQGDTRDE